MKPSPRAAFERALCLVARDGGCRYLVVLEKATRKFLRVARHDEAVKPTEEIVEVWEQGPSSHRSVTRLGASLLKAFEAGDLERIDALLPEMIRIACDPTHAGGSRAFRWLDSLTDGMLGDALRQKLWREPQIMIDMVKRLRDFATNPLTAAVDRNEAKSLLKKYGYDDESLLRNEE